MNSLRRIRNTFVRQISENDCGIACLSMILNYTGRRNDIAQLQVNMIVVAEGLSLLDLRNLAARFKLPARCVQMDIGFLRENRTPCILHMVNDQGQNHFQVCYGMRKKGNTRKYLMADPARQVYYLDECLLVRQWQSRAALYFDELRAPQNSALAPDWTFLFSMKCFPRGLWISVPLLSVCVAFFGVAISWVLQRGIDDSLVGKRNTLIFAVLFLLLMVSLFKSLFSYVRQRILINVSAAVNEQLVLSFVKEMVKGSAVNSLVPDHKSIKISMAEILKIQNAVSAFMTTLLSDGSIILLVLSELFYLMPMAGLVNCLYLILVCLLTARKLPGLSFSYAHLNELSGATENFMVKEARLSIEAENKLPQEKRVALHQQNHARYLAFARSIAVQISNMNLLHECLGTLNVIVVFALGLVKLQEQSMAYGSFIVLVVLSYFITVLMPKICNALYVIAEGAEAALQYKIKTPAHL
jgi:ABC-type bacteriocin/lantibiotic exporter with double-glycine peptidase domain